MDSLKPQTPQEAKLHFLDYWRIIRIRKTVILAVFLLVVITATLVTFILPESYASTARIRVERDQSDIQGFGPQQFNQSFDPYFIQTEFEVIKSELILGKVIEELDLNRKWGAKFNQPQLKTAETMSLLLKNLQLTPVRNTSLIEIKVFSEDRDEASKLANAIAFKYQEHRLQQRRELSMGGIDSLQKRFEEQAAKIKEKSEQIESLRQQLQIPDAMASEYAPQMTLSMETLRQLEQQRIETQAEYVRQDTLLQRLRALPMDQLIEAIPTAAQDQLLQSLLEQLTLAEQRLIVVGKDYGPEHAEVLKLTGQVEDLKQKIKKRVTGILTGLESKVASIKMGLENLQAEVAKANQKDIEEGKRFRPYFEAKRELDEMQRFRQLLSQKILMERAEVELPKLSMVEIVDQAVPSLRPAKPNKPLNIAFGVVVGLVVGIGLAFFIEYLDTSVKTIDDVERALESPVLGVIPQNVGLLIDEGPDSPHAGSLSCAAHQHPVLPQGRQAQHRRRGQRRRRRGQVDHHVQSRGGVCAERIPGADRRLRPAPSQPAQDPRRLERDWSDELPAPADEAG